MIEITDRRKYIDRYGDFIDYQHIEKAGTLTNADTNITFVYIGCHSYPDNGETCHHAEICFCEEESE